MSRRVCYRSSLIRSIVAPLAVMEQWATEASTKTVPGRLKVTTHHGPSRTKCAYRVRFSLTPAGKTLEKFDLVITTFQTLASEFKTYEETNKVNVSDEDSDSDSVAKKIVKKKGKKASHALFDVKWLRVVIGESRVWNPADDRRSAEHQKPEDQCGQGGDRPESKVQMVFDWVRCVVRIRVSLTAVLRFRCGRVSRCQGSANRRTMWRSSSPCFTSFERDRSIVGSCSMSESSNR